MEAVGYDLNGTPIHRIFLRGEGIRVAVLTYGAILQDLRIAGHDYSLVLGHPDFEPYLTDPNYFGATIGRVANRIKDGVIFVEGGRYQLDRNSPDGHHLHGGSNGTARQCWRVVDHSETHATLDIFLRDGHMGYPGALTVQVRFSVLPKQTLSVEITATSDALTVCNFAHHSYFNLSDAPTIAGHVLKAAADRFLEVDECGIPTGKVSDVTDTVFDFRAGRRLLETERYDHNLCLTDQRRALQNVARLSCPQGKTHMDIATTEAGLQIYTGQGIATGLSGADHTGYGPFSGIALEPQGWPDAPNHPDFPSIVLPSGQTYHQRTTFKFSQNI
ncbi:aldose epimerase family protein [Sulfitobacter sp.]|uniref:aldose epimerase family protein n=1 Tax=Sulfitobacter sp. TaxID=1903071 RepID=UPI003EF28A10